MTETTYQDGTQSEPLVWFNEAGTVKIVGKPKPGAEHGTYTEYYDTGEHKCKKFYRNGKMHGRYVEYHIDGKLKIHGEYNLNNKVGAWVWYDQDGRISVEKNYDK